MSAMSTAGQLQYAIHANLMLIIELADCAL